MAVDAMGDGYAGTRFILGCLAVLGWLGAAGGCGLALYGWVARVPAVPGLAVALAIGSLALLAAALLGRVLCDIADQADALRRSVEDLRHGVQQQAFAMSPPAAAAAQRPSAVESPVRPPTSGPGWPLGEFETYRGFVLAGTMRSVIADGQAFVSPEEARRYIDGRLGPVG